MVEILCNQCHLATHGAYIGMFDLVGLCGRFLQYLINKKINVTANRGRGLCIVVMDSSLALPNCEFVFSFNTTIGIEWV
jgi:hypothetical protein